MGDKWIKQFSDVLLPDEFNSYYCISNNKNLAILIQIIKISYGDLKQNFFHIIYLFNWSNLYVAHFTEQYSHVWYNKCLN